MIQAFAAMVEKAPLERFAYEPEALGSNDIELGDFAPSRSLAHSDIHLIDDDWKKSTLPGRPRARDRRARAPRWC